MTESDSFRSKRLVSALGFGERHALGQIVVVVVCTFVHLAYFLCFPLALKYILDEAVKSKNVSSLVVVLSLLGGGFLLSFVATIAQDYFAALSITQAVQRLRQSLYQRMLDLPTRAFQSTSAGELVTRFSNDLYTLEQALLKLLAKGLYNGLLASCSLLMLFWIEWRLALLTSLVIPIVYLGPWLLTERAEKHSEDRKKHEAEMVSQLQESIQGRDVVRGFGLEQRFQERFSGVSLRIGESSHRALFLGNLIGRSVSMSVFFVLLALIGAGSYLAVRSEITVGTLFAFISMLVNVSDSTEDLSDMGPVLVQGVTGARRVDALLGHLGMAESALQRRLELPPFEHRIAFDHVSFGYTKDAMNIEDVSFELPYGKSFAVVGPSGSGKSTLLHLMARSYLPDKGEILIDGHEMKELSFDSLRSQYAVVYQDSYLFDTNIRENIRFGRLGASDEEIIEAAKEAELHNIIDSFPQGYDTPVGAGGKQLSGGQRQRVALARALLRRPRLLLLDEVTSALDPVTEEAINETLKKLSGKITMFAVTHRLSSLHQVDQILVLSQKRLVEHGTHQELLEGNGVYAEMWKKQSGLHMSDDGRWASVDTERLRMIPLFSTLSDKILTEVAGLCVTERFERFETIIREGSMGSRLFLVVRGKVGVYKQPSEGAEDTKPLLIGVCEVGDYFGEISLCRDVPATATVICHSDLVCLTLSREHFLSLLAQTPSVRERVEQIIEQRLLLASQAL